MARHPLHFAAEACLGLCVAFGAFALGGAPSWALWPIAALGWLAAVLVLSGLWRTGRRARWHPVLALPLLAMAFCLLQLIPLPLAVRGWLSPPAAELANFALVPLGLDRWRALSLEPSGTWREVAKHATYAAVLFASFQLGRSSSSRVRLLGMLAAVGVTVALIGLFHRLIGLDALFGIYSYSVQPNFITTIGNPNHLAAFLTVSGVTAAGLAAGVEARRQAAIWGFLAVVVAVAALMSLSRGGIAFFLLAHAVLALTVFARRGGGWRGAAPVGIVAAAIGLALFLVSDQLFEKLHTLDSVSKVQQSKIELWPVFGEAALAFSRSGMGRGAFEVAFTRFQNQHLIFTFTHPENVVLQLVAEFGAAATLLLAAVAVACTLRLVRSKKLGLIEYAALIGVGATLLHDVFDFALELPATALAATLATGAAFSVTADAARRLPVSSAAAGAGALLICLGLAWGGGRASLAEDEKSLRELIAKDAPTDALRAHAMLLIDQHPADFLLYSMMAEVTARRGDARESLAWVNRVLFLRPADANAHTTAGSALLRLGRRTQALGEFRLAIEHGDRNAMILGVRAARTSDELERLTSDRIDLLLLVARQLRESGRMPDADVLLMPHVVPGAPLDVILYAAEVKAQRGDHAGALAMLDAVAGQHVESPAFVVAMARELAATGSYEQASAMLHTALARVPDSPELGLSLVQLHLAASRPAKAREVINRMLPFASDAKARATLLHQEARAHEAEGHPALAIKSWQTVVLLQPDLPGYYYELGRLQQQLGRLREARASVARGMKAAGPQGGAAAKPWLETLDRALEAKNGQLREMLDTADGGLAP